MYRKSLHISQKVLLFILFFLFFWGCAGQNELAETAPAGIRKKITATIPPDNTFQYDKDEHKEISDNQAMAELMASVAEKKSNTEYDPKGKIDPFKPFLSKKQEIKPDPDDIVGKPPIIAIQQCFGTPLVKMGLSQLRLVGVIRSRTGNKALVQDASNQGYIVKRGICIGLNFGRVSEILKEKIIIEEKFEDHEYVDERWKPKIITRKRELAMSQLY